MGKWTIYRKNGDVVAVTGILDAGNFVLPELSYSGTWMGERFVTVSVKSPYPIDWQIGDYLIYRNEKFVLNYDPTVVKKARKGTSGEGFVYDGVKFNSLSCECGDVRFLDEVLQDSHIHYTSLSSFTFFAATADDLADRLQANMNRYCSANGFSVSDWWLILTPSLERSRARALASGGSALAEEAVSRWNEFYTDGVSVDGERFNQNVSVSDISVLDGFALLYNLFGLHFITSGRTLAAGVSGKIAEHIFEYGKGKGLYELEKVADGNQAIVTKLFAYGNSTNLPVRYYARLNKTCFAKVRSVETGGSSFVIDIPFAYSYYNGSKNPSVASGSFQVTFLYGGKQYTCYVSSDRGYPVSKQEGYSYLSAFIGGIPSLSVGDTITFVSGIDDDKWPSGHFSYVNDGSVLPDNLAISHLMLPGFPSESLRSWVLRNGGVEKGEGLIAWRGYEAYFSEDPLSPYVQSANAKKLGVRESSLVFDGSNGTDDIHPTITGSGKDVVVRCDMIADNGIFGEGEEVPNFHLVIPSLGEDVSLDILLRSDAKISMKDGYCGGMEFDIESVNVVEDGWELTLNRAYDDALQLYFPYSFGASLGNEPSASESYQIRKGDTFVLLGIELPSSYIGMASERLLEGALQSLSGNDYTRHTYVPRVDEIYMARQHDAVVRGVDELQYGTVSLHDTLREGDLMRFEDADLSVGGTIFIDQLQIKEYGNKQIPTYDVTLRESKSVGTIERIQQEIDALSQNKSGGGGGGVSTSQVKSILNMYGDKRYIRRDIDDETDTILGAKQFVAKEKVVADRIKSKTEDVPVVVENDLNVEGNSSVRGDVEVKGDADVEEALHVKKDLSVDKNIFVGGNVGSELKPILLAFINFLKSDNYRNENLFGEGFMLTNDNGNGQSSLVVDNLFVRMKAIFNELEIRKISYAGGNIIFSHAGSRISLVKPIYKKIASVNGSSVVLVDLATVDGTTMKMEGESYLDGTTLNIDTSGEEILSYRCYIKKDDGTTETRNWWKIDDQAKCQTFNIEEGTHYNAENTYYWRRVVGIGSEKPDGSDEIYDFVDLSAADCDGGSDIPKEGDSIVQMGNRTDTSRQGFIAIEVYSEDGSAPSFKVYKNVSDYSLANKQRIVISPKETSLVVNKFSLETGYDVQRVPMFRGDWTNIEDRRCYYYDIVMHNGSTWLCVYPESEEDGTTEEPSETSSYWKVYAKQGATGRGIMSVQEYYLATDKSEGVTNEDEGFTTEVQSTTAEKPYLWNYELTILTDNTHSKTDAQMVGMYTEDGKGIHSIVNYYLATNKADGITTGTAGWTTSVQSIDAAKPYLWNYEKITYTKGEPTKTDPHIIGFFGTSAAMLVCTPSLISIPTDTEGRVLEYYEQKISLSLYAGGKSIGISSFSVNESGYSKYISQEGGLAINSATVGGATVSGSNLTISRNALRVEGTRLIFQNGAVKITQASVDSAVVKVYKDAILTEKDAQIYAYGYNEGGFKYEAYADIRIQRQYVAEDGKDGKNGKDGFDGDDGISMYLDNTAVLFTQDVKDANVITPSSVDVNVNVVKGKTPVATGVSVFFLSADNFNKTGVKIDGTKITLSANGIQTYQEDGKFYFCEQGSVTFNVIYRGLISTLTLRWLLNAIGKFKTTVEGDVETSIARKMVYGVNDGEVQTIEQVGEYIRSSSEAVTTLSKTVDGVVKSVTELEITADGLTSRVEDNEDNYSQISQRVDNIALKVGASPNLFYNAFFDRNLTEVLGGTLPDTAVVLIEDNYALYGKNVLSFGSGNFTGNHRTGFMGADTKGYGVFLREGTYTFKVRARVTNSYTQGDAGITLAWDSAPNMGNYTSSKILQKISVKSTEYNVFSYSFTLTTGRYVAFYLYFTDASVGGGGLQILVDAVSLKSGDTNEGFDVGNDSSSAGEAVDTMGEMLYDTGIDIEHKKITFTSDNFVYRNNKGETTALLDESGNMTIAGVYNNEVNDITDANANKYGYHYTQQNIFFLDPLKCPAVVRINFEELSKIILPVAYNGNTSSSPVTYIEGSKAGGAEVHHTLEEMRQCIGKKIWLLRGNLLQGVDFALQSGGHATSESPKLMMHIWDEVPDFASMTGAVSRTESVAIGHIVTGTDYAYRNYVLECKMGIYNGYECIYWEVRVSGIRLT